MSVIAASCFVIDASSLGIVDALSTLEHDSGVGDVWLGAAGLDSSASDPYTIVFTTEGSTGEMASEFQDIFYNRIWIIHRVRHFGDIANARFVNVEVWNSFFESRDFGPISEIGDVDNLVSITGLASGSFPKLKSRIYRVDVDDLVTIPSVDVTYDWDFDGLGDTGQVFRVTAGLLVYPDLVISPDTHSVPEGDTVDYDTTGGSGAFEAVEWSVTGDSTIDENGTVTAGTAGVYEVTAYDTVADYSDTAELIITSPVFITPDTAVIETGDTFDFNATGGSSTEYEWSVTGLNTIDEDGVVTGVEEGIWVVTVYEPFSGFSDTALLGVSLECEECDDPFVLERGQEFPLVLPENT